MASQFNKKSKLALVTNEGPDELNEHLREWIRHTDYDSENPRWPQLESETQHYRSVVMELFKYDK